MQDSHGGLQRFLFEWLGWPRQGVMTSKGEAEIYLENLAPLFYIDQNEGWTDIQALQVLRYGQQHIAEIAVEYLLGAVDAIEMRVARQRAVQREAGLREAARTISQQIETLFLRNGWNVEWSGSGSVGEVLGRWSSRTLREALLRDAGVDLAKLRVDLSSRAEVLRRDLTSGPIDPADASAPASASQRVIESKRRRHELNSELRTLRDQRRQAEELVASLEHRIKAASDVLRLKTSGVGRLDRVECPTCHRDLDPATFSLTVQSRDAVAAHIDALQRDRDLMRRNFVSIEARLTSIVAELERVNVEHREAERALANVTAAVGTVREQLAKIAADLSSVERQIDRVSEVARELDELQKAVDNWVVAARASTGVPQSTPELELRKSTFLDSLKQYVLALGHSAVNDITVEMLHLDEQYTPYLDNRRLRSLGSASDQSRLVAAYCLALAAAAERLRGLHPGVVILDEPLQQNPDAAHRELFLAFLSKQLARQAEFQTVIFTWLQPQEIAFLREQGTNVVTPPGDHFLKLGEPSSPDGQSGSAPAPEPVEGGLP